MGKGHLLASLALAIASLALLGLAKSSFAATSTDDPAGFVTATSRFGNGTIKARTRHSALGWSVELPGGNWVYCRRSCSETLRVETVDFFQSNAAGFGQITNECGIFGCLDLKYGH